MTSSDHQFDDLDFLLRDGLKGQSASVINEKKSWARLRNRVLQQPTGRVDLATRVLVELGLTRRLELGYSWYWTIPEPGLPFAIRLGR